MILLFFKFNKTINNIIELRVLTDCPHQKDFASKKWLSRYL